MLPFGTKKVNRTPKVYQSKAMLSNVCRDVGKMILQVVYVKTVDFLAK